MSVAGNPVPKRAVMFTLLPFVVDMFEELLRERGHRLVGIVTAPGPRIRRSEEYRAIAQLARPGLDVIISNYPNRWAGMIRPLKPDLIFCAGSNWKIPAEVLDVPPLGAFNAHDALLPKNRGRNSTGWALRTGHSGYGFTIHRMTPEFDDGPILAQREIVIGDDEDIDDIIPRMMDSSREALGEALDLVLDGFPGVPQDESMATFTGGGFDPDWREIDWNNPVKDVFFQIRSWYGVRDVPRGAFGEIDGQRVLITKAKPVYEPVEPSHAPPGTVLSRTADEILVQCQDGPLRIMRWEAVPT
jgi:methionyl-tRNA formyltransferase